MEGAIVLIIIVLLVLFLAPIIIASNTRSRIDSLSRQINEMENKLDEVLNRNIKRTGNIIEEIKPVPKPPRHYATRDVPPVITENPTNPVPEFETKVMISVETNEIVTPPEVESQNKVDEWKASEHHQEEQYQPLSNYSGGTWWDRFNAKNPDLEKFVGENLISKIGIAVLVLGIAFFVKYAIDKEWINEYARVGIGMLAGGIVLVFAHRLREKFKAFSSILVSGAIAIFYFTITIGFQDYKIFSQPVAFAIMIGITVFSVFISLAYNRQELAVLSLIGGFAAPFMVSTGDGNYKVLFSYLLILDLGMLVISFMRNWKLVYLLSYVFTILIFGAWYYDNVTDQSNLHAGAMVFASLFYITFFMMGIINNIREKKTFQAADISMILIINSLFCGVGLHVFSNYHPELKGTFIIVLAAFNFINSWILYRRYNADKTLIYLLIGLTLTYATLAAPVQLHGNYITLFWAAEAVLLMWLAQRSELKIFRFSSVIVHLLMFISLAMDWQQIYLIQQSQSLEIIFNKGFLTYLFCIISLYLQSYLLSKENVDVSFADFNFNSKNYYSIILVASVTAGYIAGFLELNYQVSHRISFDTLNRIIISTYHLLFSLFLIYFILRNNRERAVFFSFILQLINIVLILFNFADLPFELLRNAFNYNTSLQPGLLIHYFALIAFSYSCIIMYKFLLGSNITTTAIKKIAHWTGSFLAIYILSGELMLHLCSYAFHPASPTSDESISTVMDLYGLFQRQVVKIGFPILWGVIAFVFLTIGINKQIKELRIISLALLAITLLKLFIYDIKDVSEAGKISAFILLGILLLVMSFMYQKIKAIILDDEK